MPQPSSARRPAVLLMTATVAPPSGMPELARVDPKVRLDDYANALAFYLTVPDCCYDRILFLENSGADLSALKQIVREANAAKRVEFIVADMSDEPAAYGKGFHEFRMIDFALERSKLVQSDDLLWKVTGRLKFLNIEQIIAGAPERFDLYCDLRNVPFIGHRFGGNQWMELRIFACTLATYGRLIRGRYPDFRADKLEGAPEQALYEVVMAARSEITLAPRFRTQPRLEGHGGRMNVDYAAGAYRYKHLLRSAVRQVAPWLWL